MCLIVVTPHGRSLDDWQVNSRHIALRSTPRCTLLATQCHPAAKPLCVADGGGVPQLWRGEGDVQSREGRLGDAHGHQVPPSAAKKALGGLKLEGLGDIGVVVLDAAECVAALLWYMSFGWHAVLRDSGRAASIKASPSATTLLSWTPRWSKCSCRAVASR